jgi:hypothetical protein
MQRLFFVDTFFFPVLTHRQGVKVDLKTLVDQDANDESLRKYKEALLGNVANTYSPKDDPRRVVITQLKIVVEGGCPGGVLVFC